MSIRASGLRQVQFTLTSKMGGHDADIQRKPESGSAVSVTALKLDHLKIAMSGATKCSPALPEAMGFEQICCDLNNGRKATFQCLCRHNYALQRPLPYDVRQKLPAGNPPQSRRPAQRIRSRG